MGSLSAARTAFMTGNDGRGCGSTFIFWFLAALVATLTFIVLWEIIR